MTASYFYAWTPLVVVTAVFVLSMPWLGLIALMIVAVVAVGVLGALAWAVVIVASLLGRAISRRWHLGSDASPRAAPARSPTRPQHDTIGQEVLSHPATLSVRRELQAPQHTYSEAHEADGQRHDPSLWLAP
jgi:hypothetical protein